MWAVLMAMVQLADGGACARSCVASGEAPRWSIHDDAGRWSLHIAGRPAAALVPGAWRDTPAGRRLTGTTARGRFTLLATFGACGGPRARVAERSSHFATLTLPDGLVLRGCMSARGTAY
jgi:uncharacterized membrane protein